MKIRKIFAGMAALAMAATMAVSASADYEIPADCIVESDGTFWAYIFGGNDQQNPKIYSDLAELENITGFKISVKMKDPGDEYWHGGAYGTNSDMGGWKSAGDLVQGEDITDAVIETSYKKLIKKPEEQYVQVWAQQWWGDDAKEANELNDFVESMSVTVLGCDAPKAAPAEETPAEETPKEDTPKEETPKTDDTPKAGAAAGIALAGIAVAGAAFVATKRK
ncbi:MAG: NPXTG-anchored protein [Ruminococcus sp.]|nr:NPXTG-anchored protein [Ruminococcus sp.]